MNYRLIHGHELSHDLTRRWAEIQEADPMLASPYFRPEFTECVASVRNDVYVGLLEDGNSIMGFFPFHRGRGGIGRPVGLGLSDYDGVIAQAETEWSVKELLRACGLIRYEFSHLPANQRQFEAYFQSVGESSIIEVDSDYALYEAKRRQLGDKQLKGTLRCKRKLEREYEPLRFELDSQSHAVFQQMIDWKRQQCQETGVIDFFANRWTVDLVQRIHQHESLSFGGKLSALHLGESLLAVHFFMFSQSVWHAWFPRYDYAFSKFSPGLILLIEMIQSACELPIVHIDIGKDLTPWKERFRTNALSMAEGCAEIPSLLNHALHLRDRAERWSRSSKLRPILRIPGRVVKGIERKKRFG